MAYNIITYGAIPQVDIQKLRDMLINQGMYKRIQVGSIIYLWHSFK